ncbi:protein kinase [Aureococcus anophagefferens]|nr:protein kinase [Aureococcus anophagefferens]
MADPEHEIPALSVEPDTPGAAASSFGERAADAADGANGYCGVPPLRSLPDSLRLKFHHKREIRVVAVNRRTERISFRTLKQRLTTDYGFERSLAYQDGDGDLITLASQNDLNELLNTDSSVANVRVIPRELAAPGDDEPAAVAVAAGVGAAAAAAAAPANTNAAAARQRGEAADAAPRDRAAGAPLRGGVPSGPLKIHTLISSPTPNKNASATLDPLRAPLSPLPPSHELAADDPLPAPAPQIAASPPAATRRHHHLHAPIEKSERPAKDRREPAPAAPSPGGASRATGGAAPRAIRWQRGEMIGKGAFGSVYLSLNLDTGELMAVKHLDCAEVSSRERSALENEVSMMKGLCHPNIVRYLGVDSSNDALAIFLEYVPGGSLRSLLDKFGKLEEDIVRLYSRQILLGLEYLHGNAIAHRDIKAANVLVSNDGSVKLADFGASKRMAAPSNLNGGGAVIKAAPKSQGWRKADVWSVGCTVIEMSTGRPPWSQYSNPVTAMYHIACVEELPDMPPNLSDDGIQFLWLCFQREPRLRPEVTALLFQGFVSVAPTAWRETRTNYQDHRSAYAAAQGHHSAQDSLYPSRPSTASESHGLGVRRSASLRIITDGNVFDRRPEPDGDAFGHRRQPNGDVHAARPPAPPRAPQSPHAPGAASTVAPSLGSSLESGASSDVNGGMLLSPRPRAGGRGGGGAINVVGGRGKTRHATPKGRKADSDDDGSESDGKQSSLREGEPAKRKFFPKREPPRAKRGEADDAPSLANAALRRPFEFSAPPPNPARIPPLGLDAAGSTPILGRHSFGARSASSAGSLDAAGRHIRKGLHAPVSALSAPESPPPPDESPHRAADGPAPRRLAISPGEPFLEEDCESDDEVGTPVSPSSIGTPQSQREAATPREDRAAAAVDELALTGGDGSFAVPSHEGTPTGGSPSPSRPGLEAVWGSDGSRRRGAALEGSVGSALACDESIADDFEAHEDLGRRASASLPMAVICDDAATYADLDRGFRDDDSCVDDVADDDEPPPPISPDGTVPYEGSPSAAPASPRRRRGRGPGGRGGRRRLRAAAAAALARRGREAARVRGLRRRRPHRRLRRRRRRGRRDAAPRGVRRRRAARRRGQRRRATRWRSPKQGDAPAPAPDRAGGSNGVTCVVFTPGGDRVVTGCEDRVARIWSLETGVVVHALEGHESRVTCVQMLAADAAGTDPESPGGPRRGKPGTSAQWSGCVVTASADHTVRLWDVRMRRPQALALRGHTDTVNALAADADNMVWSASRDTSVRAWDLRCGRGKFHLTQHFGGVTCLAYDASLDGDRGGLLSGARDTTVHVWAKASGACMRALRSQRGFVQALAVVPKRRAGASSLVACGGTNGKLRLWDHHKGKCVKAIEAHATSVTCCQFATTQHGAPNGFLVSGGGDGCVKVWDARSMVPRRTLASHGNAVVDVAVVDGDSDVGPRVFSTSKDGTLRVAHL